MKDFKIIEYWDFQLRSLDFVICLTQTQKLTNQKSHSLFVLFAKFLNLVHTASNDFIYVYIISTLLYSLCNNCQNFKRGCVFPMVV